MDFIVKETKNLFKDLKEFASQYTNQELTKEISGIVKDQVKELSQYPNKTLKVLAEKATEMNEKAKDILDKMM
ncbi:MAG TPA: hypothetical protein QKA14_02220, partial [Candidatus Megaira endosymbiont of Hartmannula sinica]|nr:hypothetical protein [Candidatus Megaera endosymbiont of Hartmannula sinica]